jgi:ABC-type antimicrobial peptide transport system permease subunit
VIGAALGPLVSAALVALRGIFAFRLPSEAGVLPVLALFAVLALSALAAAWVPGRRALQISIADALKADY